MVLVVDTLHLQPMLSSRIPAVAGAVNGTLNKGVLMEPGTDVDASTRRRMACPA